MTGEFLQQSLDNQYYIELHLLVSFIVSHGLRGYMHAHIRVSVGFKIVSRKTAKTFSQEYIRIEHFFIWLATCNELPEPVFKKLPMGVVYSSNLLLLLAVSISPLIPMTTIGTGSYIGFKLFFSLFSTMCVFFCQRMSSYCLFALCHASVFCRRPDNLFFFSLPGIYRAASVQTLIC